MRMIEVLNPVASAAKLEFKNAPRMDNLEGKIIGFLDNSKPNFDLFLDRVEGLLGERVKLAKIVRENKALPGIPCPADKIARLIECNAVINGMSD
ncbi:hypothetical protein ACFLXH_04455 [Chloroflexota bacterium]